MPLCLSTNIRIFVSADWPFILSILLHPAHVVSPHLAVDCHAVVIGIQDQEIISTLYRVVKMVSMVCMEIRSTDTANRTYTLL
jgi:hypothetical protein